MARPTHSSPNGKASRLRRETRRRALDSPRVINVDKNAAYPKAVDDLKADHILSESFELRPVKYLKNIVEQDHRFIKRLVNPGMGFGSFNEREANFEGVRNNEYDTFGTNFGS